MKKNNRITNKSVGIYISSLEDFKCVSTISGALCVSQDGVMEMLL